MCITEIFYEVWAENSLSKPTYPYLNPPKGRLLFVFTLYFVPVFLERLLGLVVAEIVIPAVFKQVGQILLLYIVVGEAVRIKVVLTLDRRIITVKMLVLLSARYRTAFAAFDVSHCGVYRVVRGV